MSVGSREPLIAKTISNRCILCLCDSTGMTVVDIKNISRWKTSQLEDELVKRQFVFKSGSNKVELVTLLVN